MIETAFWGVVALGMAYGSSPFFDWYTRRRNA